MYRLICLDIDGTLLNSQHKITAKVKAAVQKAAKRGLCPVLVSARMPQGMRFLMEELSLNTPMICYSGALLLDDAGTYAQKTLAAASVETIWTAAKKQQIHVSLYKNDRWYIEALDDWAREESRITHITPQIADYRQLLGHWQAAGDGPNKILCLAEADKLQNFMSQLHLADVTVYRSKPTYLEIGHGEASKTAAIRLLAEKLHIAREEILAIGDNYNDIDMLEYAGLGIAMGNAPPEVKARANATTATNDADGVASAIEKYCFGQ